MVQSDGLKPNQHQESTGSKTLSTCLIIIKLSFSRSPPYLASALSILTKLDPVVKRPQLFHLLLLHDPRTQTAASKCTVFSTYIRRYIHDNANAADIIWRNTKTTPYWQTNVWVIPIHDRDSGHWVVSTIYINEGCILFSDSLVTRSTPQPWLLVCSLAAGLHFHLQVSLASRSSNFNTCN